MASFSTPQFPFLTLQSDWQSALREGEGQAWVTCKFSGQPGHHGDLRLMGFSGDQVPYVAPSEGFRVGSVTKNSIEIIHEEPNCKCVFYAPQETFKNIHHKGVITMDVASGGLGVSACTQNKLLVWETSRGLMRRQLDGHLGDIYTCRFFPSGIVVLSAGADMQLKIWSAETGACPVSLVGHVGAILDTAIVDRGRNVISVSRDGTARLWDCGQAACLATLAKVDDTINGCDLTATSADLGSSVSQTNEREVGTGGKLLVLACEDRYLRGVGVHSRQMVFEFPCSSAVNCCSCLSGTDVVCGTQDGHLLHVDIRNTRSPVQSWLHSAAAVTSVLPYRNGFFSSQSDGISMFHKTNSEESCQLTGPDCDPVYKIVSDGTHLYACCRDGAIRKYPQIT